jgi:ribosomal protein L7/L12
MNSLPNNYTQLHAVIYVYLYVALYGDKKKSLDEIDAIKNLIKDWDQSGNADAVYKETKEWFEQDKANGNRKNSFELCIDYLIESLDRFHKPGFIQDLKTISKADGEITDGEIELISNISQKFGISIDMENPSTPKPIATGTPKRTSRNMYDVLVNIGETNRIAVIKLYSQLHECDLQTAREKLSQYPAVFAHSVEKSQADKMYEICTKIGVETFVVKQGTTFSIFMEHAGYNKLEVVKIIAEINKTGLKEAKDITDNTPCLVVQGIDQVSATIFKLKLEDVGANAKIIETYNAID